MEYIYTACYEKLGQEAARWVGREILRQPQLVLGLPTGSTPVSMYRYLVHLVKEGLISFRNVQTFNLDEYVGLASTHSQSYAAFMQEHLWGKVDLASNAADIPRGDVTDMEAECQRYDDHLRAVGGLDIQVLGIGLNGHIGFNEPSHNLEIGTHVVNLTPETIQTNARFFSSINDVPRQAITMGMGSIMRARKILLLVIGENKKEILQKTLYGPVTPEVPASILQLHTDLTVMSDISL